MKVNIGLGYGYRTPFGSGTVKLPTANIYKRSFDRKGVMSTEPSGITYLEASGSLTLINLGVNLKINGQEPYIEANGSFLGWQFGSNGVLINNSLGYHFGFVGVEFYQKTNDFNNYFSAYPSARQSFYEKTGFSMPWR